ncbi:MAG: hypothetical protein ACYTBJ_26575 [Planctomycetota bacterium]|jgi:hypothetical protein
MHQVGDILTLSSGGFEEYHVDEVVRVLKPFDMLEVLKQWAAVTGSKLVTRKAYSYYNGSLAEFRGWLLMQGYLESIAHEEVHLGEDPYQIELREM